jgi:hypothetical protein
MKKQLIAGVILSAYIIGISAVQASIATFYTDRAAFEAQLSSSTTIDFEGIAPDSGTVNWTPGLTDVAFTGLSPRVVGANALGGYYGVPYQSALLTIGYRGTVTADLTPAGSGFTAVGGWFGNIMEDTGATLILHGSGGVLDTQTIIAGDLGAGEVEQFYGWIVEGDEITAVSHAVDSYFEGIDNFTYGYAIPEPSITALAGVTFLGFLAVRRIFII